MGTSYMSMNLQNELFQDVNVRKALSLALDRDYIANTVQQEMCIRDRLPTRRPPWA